MTAVSTDYISFYQPPTTTVSHRNKYDSPSYRKAHSVCAVSSGPLVAPQRGMANNGLDHSGNDETDDDFPLVEELLRVALSKEASTTEPSDPLHPLQHLDELPLEASSNPSLGHAQLANRRGDSQGRPTGCRSL
jgi:hypothetical protein